MNTTQVFECGAVDRSINRFVQGVPNVGELTLPHTPLDSREYVLSLFTGAPVQ